MKTVLENKGIVPEGQTGADPFVMLYLMKNKKKFKPSKKDLTKFENAKFTLFVSPPFFPILPDENPIFFCMKTELTHF